eukprot:2648729-Pleurochrysis_carterae.AAC.1
MVRGSGRTGRRCSRGLFGRRQQTALRVRGVRPRKDGGRNNSRSQAWRTHRHERWSCFQRRLPTRQTQPRSVIDQKGRQVRSML